MAQRTLAADRTDERLRMTFEEYLEWSGSDIRAEWVNGEVIIFLTPFVRHADVVGFVFNLLSYVVRKRGLGRVFAAAFEMRLSVIPSSREPDVAFVATEHLDRIRGARVDGPADFAVEVVSNDSVTRDRRDKLGEYAAAGVREYLVVEGREARRGVTLWRLHDEGHFAEVRPDEAGLLRSTVLPGFWIDPVWFDEDPMPDPFEIGDAMVGRVVEREQTP